MTAIDPRPPALPEIGQKRYACDVRTGWHVRDHGVWHLVLDVAAQPGEAVLLVLREGAHESQDLRLPRFARLMTRTPEEQISYVEAQCLRMLAHTAAAGLR